MPVWNKYVDMYFQSSLFIPAKPLHKCDIVSVHLIIFIAWEFATN